MTSTVCTICRNLILNLRPGTNKAVKFMQLRHVYEKAESGCDSCDLLKRSFEAVQGSRAQVALKDSGSFSSTDFRIIYEELGHGRKVGFEFEHPDYRLSVDLFSVEGKPNPRKWTTNKPESTSQHSQSSLSVVENWIKECTTQHKVCGTGSLTQPPKRILDLGQDDAVVYLIEPEHTMQARYVCQSYCWGNSRTVITTRDNIQSHRMQGLRVEDLPKTFRDTIAFSKSLGLRYLWIDSLCIIQDEKFDWQEEAAKMCRYYSNAYITLAATMSSNADGGLFQPNDIIELNDGGQTWCIQAKRHLQTATLNNAPLFQRGWIFQERLLSPRVLHFGPTELCFECNVRSVCECGRDMPDMGWQIKQSYLNGPDWKRDTPTLADIWHIMVVAYCRLSLTKDSDKLPALSGLADQMHSRRNSRYFAGLWEDSLLEDLLWSVYRADYQRSAKSDIWRAPSWSWVSVTDPANYAGYPRLYEVYAEVLDAHCSYVGPSSTGELRSGHLILEGPIIQGSVKDGRSLYENADATKPVSGYFSSDYKLSEGIMPVSILRVGRDTRGRGREYLLILRNVGNGGGVEMERIGLFDFFPLNNQWLQMNWEGAEVRQVRIV